MADPIQLTLAEAEELCVRALLASNTSEPNARPTASALVSAEADGQRGHGLSRVPSYAAQARCGKVDGFAEPQLERVATALLSVDARSGFAYPAIDLACKALPDIVNETGVAAACIRRSHHLGQAGAHVERLANEGLVSLLFSNSPKAITFWGGRKPMMGTNPIAFAAPRPEKEALVIDLSLSRVARGKVLAAKQAGESIPDSWAVDAEGQPTTDPDAALRGSMLPIGNAKGSALVLMVEILAAALTGSRFGYEASSFFDDAGDSPDIGHTLIAFHPGLASGGQFESRLGNILGELENTEGARLPGSSRLLHRERARNDGIEIAPPLFAAIQAIIENGETHG